MNIRSEVEVAPGEHHFIVSGNSSKGIPITASWGGLHLLVLNQRGPRDIIVRTTLHDGVVQINIYPRDQAPQGTPEAVTRVADLMEKKGSSRLPSR